MQNVQILLHVKVSPKYFCSTTLPVDWVLASVTSTSTKLQRIFAQEIMKPCGKQMYM